MLFVILMTLYLQALSQRALPGFTLTELGNGRVSISWINPYPSCNQLAVQRSTDGVNFRTIFSAQSPELPTNGYVDNKMPIGVKVYYRIFYVLKGGSWFFTENKSPGEIKQEDELSERIQMPIVIAGKDSLSSDASINVIGPKDERRLMSNADYKRFRDSIGKNTKDTLQLIKAGEIRWKPFIPKPKDYVSVFVKDTLLVQIELPFYKRFRDSVAMNTKDTLYNITTFRAELKRYIPKPVWKPSVYVYTNNSGYVTLSLPNADKVHYKLVVYDMEDKEQFSIARVREPELILDKSNFKKAGWYQFELFLNGNLLDKNRFFLPKN